MHAYEAIEQSLTFIEEHLTKEISTEELANTVGLSAFYLQLFNSTVKYVHLSVFPHKLLFFIHDTGFCQAVPLFPYKPWYFFKFQKFIP